MSENEDFWLTAQQPAYLALTAQGVLATKYFGLSHVSEQYYAAIITGVLEPNIYRGDATTPANLNITHPTILDQLNANGLTYKQDESRCDSTTKYPCGTHLDQQITTILWGPMVPNNITNNKYWNHFSIARTVEDNWGLKPLVTTDANATAFDFLLANPSAGNPSSSGGSSMSGNGIPGDQTNSATTLVKASMSLGLTGMVAGLLGVLPSVVSF